jgi:hypothetical protein
LTAGGAVLVSITANIEAIDFKYVIQISLHRRRFYAGRSPIKSGIFATDSTIIHYARLHTLLTQDSPINVRIFQDREKAAEWLGVPIKRLMLKAECTKTNHEG